MEDVAVIGFLPQADIEVGMAWSALDLAAKSAGGTTLRHWQGGEDAYYGVFRDLEAPAQFDPGLVEVEIVARGYISIADAAELPGALNYELQMAVPMGYGEVLVCTCGSYEGAHWPRCPMAR
jgi:hypothetical protein